MSRYIKTDIGGHPSIITGKPYPIAPHARTKQGGEIVVVQIENGQKILASIGHEHDAWAECAEQPNPETILVQYFVFNGDRSEACAFNNLKDAKFAAGFKRYGNVVSTLAAHMHDGHAEYEDETLEIWRIDRILCDQNGTPEFLKIAPAIPRKMKPEDAE